MRKPKSDVEISDEEEISTLQSECKTSISSEYVNGEGDDYRLLLDGNQTQDKIDRLTEITVLQQKMIIKLMDRISVIEQELLINCTPTRLDLIDERICKVEPSKDYG
jgi:hypothetical protein